MDPPALTLAPGASAPLLLRYQPKALGHHSAAVAFSLLPGGEPALGGSSTLGSGTQVATLSSTGSSSCSGAGGGGKSSGAGGGSVLATEVVEALGSCLALGERAALPGGPEATPETFTKQK